VTAPTKKVLKIAHRGAETSFDPAKISDLYSRCITTQIFESLYGYDHLARPVKVIPVLADGMPSFARTSASGRSASSAESISPTTRVQGQASRADRRGCPLPLKRLVDPATRAR
jgi:hypothetical protein